LAATICANVVSALGRGCASLVKMVTPVAHAHFARFEQTRARAERAGNIRRRDPAR
jgi:hypothetical protein